MGRLRALIPIALALVIAIAGSVFIYNWMQEQTTRQDTVEKAREEAPPTQEVAVAALDISAGTQLTKEMLQTGQYLKKNLPPGSFTDPDQLLGRVALAPFKKNEPIVDHRLAPTDIKSGGVSALISKGNRAVSLGGNKVLGISGFVLPGSRVDVMVTWNDPDSGEQITKRILDNVKILATSTKMQETENGGTAPVDVYTLEVTPEEAEILTHIRNQGRLQMALRNPTDNEPVMTDGATAKDSMAYMLKENGLLQQARNKPDADSEQKVAKAPTSPPPPQPTVVEVIRGNKLVEMNF